MTLGLALLHRSGRALFVSLALLANLFATGVPVLHAWAHEADEAHHEVVPVAVAVDHAHDEVHPQALHEEGLVVKRAALDLAPALPPPTFDLESFAGLTIPVLHPVAPALSRGPPAPSSARAPPLA